MENLASNYAILTIEAGSDFLVGVQDEGHGLGVVHAFLKECHEPLVEQLQVKSLNITWSRIEQALRIVDLHARLLNQDRVHFLFPLIGLLHLLEILLDIDAVFIPLRVDYILILSCDLTMKTNYYLIGLLD